VAEWLRYIEHDKARRPSTMRDYRSAANGSLLAAFGPGTPLDQIDGDRIEQFRQKLLGSVSRRTTQKLLVLLNGVMKRAVALGWITSNPADAIEPVNITRSGEFNVLSVAQIELVARQADPLYSAAIVLSAYTGLRTGELRALRWGDVSFERATIQVSRNRPTGGEEGAPKSGRVRSVPLIDDAARALDGLSRRGGFTEPDDLVFCTEAGDPLTETAIRLALYEAMESAGIDRKAFRAKRGFTAHDLRHTFGTLAAQVWPLHDVQAFMGHANIQTTMIYAHHIPKVDAAQRLTEFVNAEKAVYPTVSRTAENQEQQPATTGTETRLADATVSPTP
jgi:integrase